MLKELSREQACILAKAARRQRDVLLGHVPESELGGSQPGRGEHNPTAELGLEPLPAGATQADAIRSKNGCSTGDALSRVSESRSTTATCDDGPRPVAGHPRIAEQACGGRVVLATRISAHHLSRLCGAISSLTETPNTRR